MKKNIIITLTFVLISSCILSQNLVNNYSFNDAYTCPQHFTIYPEHRFLPHWFNPTKGTPDHFHVCSDSISGIPDNFAGYMLPFSGRAYAGIILREVFYDTESDDGFSGVSREYIQTKLKRPLRQNQLYCVSLYYANSSKSVYSVDALGVAITRDQISARDAGKIIQIPQVINRPGNIMNNKKHWENLCGVYRARGNEKYLTIGNFYSNAQTEFVENTDEHVDSSFVYAYYYIDDVRVFEIENHFECACSEINSFGMDMLADNFDPQTGYNSKNYSDMLLEKSLEAQMADYSGETMNFDSLLSGIIDSSYFDYLNSKNFDAYGDGNIDSLLDILGLNAFQTDYLSGINRLDIKELLRNAGLSDLFNTDDFGDFDNYDSNISDSLMNNWAENYIASSFFGDINNSRLQSLLLFNLLADLADELIAKHELELPSSFGFRNPLGESESVINFDNFLNVNIGDNFVLNRVFFEFDSYELLSVSSIELDNLFEILSQKPEIQIEIQGHTDNIGSNRYNRRLSSRRAGSVYNYLLSRGISENRMEYSGLGSDYPIADNDTEDGRAKNRRVEIVITQVK